MKSIIKGMYNSDLPSFRELGIKSSEYSEALEQLLNAESRLLEAYPDSQKLFEEYQQAQIRVSGIISYQAFNAGFKVGARIIAEILEPLE